MGCLNRKQLLLKEPIQMEKVQINEEDFVFVRQMSGRERDRFEQSIIKRVKGPKGEETQTVMTDFRAKLAVATVCDEKGEYLLDAEDIPTLSQNMTAATLEKIVEVANRLNKISEKDKEELTKN